MNTEKQYVAVYQFTTGEVGYFYLGATSITEAKKEALARLSNRELLHIQQTGMPGLLVRNKYLRESRLEA